MQVTLSKPNSIQTFWLNREKSVAWRTIALFLLIIAGFSGLIIGLSWSFVTSIQAIPISTVLMYLSFTVIHEAGHRNIAQGVECMMPIERIMGWICSTTFIIIPFSLFARIHDYHHAHTNDPERDPDYWVSSDSWMSASLKSLALPIHYIMLGSSRFRRDPVFQKARKSALVYWSCMSILLAYLVSIGLGEIVLIAWVLPVILASFILAMLFDWIPHRPNIQQSQYQNTRIYLAPFANVLTLGQNYHLIHHLNPRIPWYAYKDAFSQFRDELKSNDAPIEELVAGQLPKLFEAPSILNAHNRGVAGKYTLSVKSLSRPTLDSICITFDENETRGFYFKAGQHVTVSKLINNELYTRCYSICSAQTSQQLSIVVKYVPSSGTSHSMSHYLNNRLKVGDKLTVAGPLGNFVLDNNVDKPRRLVLIAAGSGITPIMSMMRSVLSEWDEKPPIDLIYCNHSQGNIIFKSEIDEMSIQYQDKLTVHYVNSRGTVSGGSTKGRLTPSLIKTFIATSTKGTHSYICGPQTLKVMAKQALLDIGVLEHNIWCEAFVKAQRQPSNKRFNVTIELSSGEKPTIQVAENQTVLEVAKQQGISLPYACGIGQCGCCRLNRISGTENYVNDNALALLNSEREEGQTLACQCQPRSDMYLKALQH